MKSESIADAPLGAFCNTFNLHLVIIALENHFLVFLRVAVLHRFYSIFDFLCFLFVIVIVSFPHSARVGL